MINKKLHYVWVGGNPIPKRVQEIIDQAKKVLGKSWTIKIWTEKEFDIESNPFTSYWYKKGNWAFVSDYIRAYAIHKEGGFYTDTDIWLNASLTPLTKYDYVASRTYLSENTMSIFGSKKGSSILKMYMNVMSHPKLIKKPPRIMSTDIHTYALNKTLEIPVENSDFIKDNIAVLKESKLQIDLNDEDNIAIHEHHDNWKANNEEGNVSKYYDKKVEFYKGITDSKIKRAIAHKNKMIKKIDRLYR